MKPKIKRLIRIQRLHLFANDCETMVAFDQDDAIRAWEEWTNAKWDETYEQFGRIGDHAIITIYSEPDDWKFWMHKWNGIHWVICGCESGPGARPMNMDWARSVRDQCQVADVPFFFKQAMIGGKLVHMPALDGVVWDQFPEAA